MTKNRLVLLFGEFVVIVVGVLVALAVDDFAQRRADRELEGHLTERLWTDLAADAGDLALAQTQVARRRWLFAAFEESLRTGQPPASPPDSLVRMEGAARLLEDAGRPGEAADAREWTDPIARPLLSLRRKPEFDLSDDAYQEMLSVGALRILGDPQTPDGNHGVLPHGRRHGCERNQSRALLGSVPASHLELQADYLDRIGVARLALEEALVASATR
jgi:hypothetical protein